MAESRLLRWTDIAPEQMNSLTTRQYVVGTNTMLARLVLKKGAHSKTDELKATQRLHAVLQHQPCQHRIRAHHILPRRQRVHLFRSNIRPAK